MDTAGEMGQDRDRGEGDQHGADHMTWDPPGDHQKKGEGAVGYLLQTEGHPAEEVSGTLREQRPSRPQRLSSCSAGHGHLKRSRYNPNGPHRTDSTTEASSSRPARTARVTAAVAGGDTEAGLTRGGRKQAIVRATKTKQLRRTSRKELKVELANVWTWTLFFTWR